MAFFPPIPARYHVKGDQVAGKNLIPFARKQLQKLHESMAGVPGVRQLTKRPQTARRTIRFNDGTIFNMSINCGLAFVDIIVPTTGGDVSYSKQYYDKCFCNINFAVCRVVSKHDYSEGTTEGYEGDNVRYNLEVCNKTGNPCPSGHGYVLYENCLITDFISVTPDEETNGDEAGWINCGLVLLYNFNEGQMGEVPIDPQDKASNPVKAGKDITSNDAPIYKVLPIFEAITATLDLVPEWEFKKKECP